MNRYHVLTLFPEMIENGLKTSITGRAIENGTIGLNAINIRDFADNKHNKVDDYPYGGGAGMVMQAEPVYRAWASVTEKTYIVTRTIYVTPQGTTFHQGMAEELAKEEDVIFLCGHYEGVDERVLEEIVTDYVSIGDYVLTGGEFPAMVMIDAISRLVPGVLNNEVSAEFESFQDFWNIPSTAARRCGTIKRYRRCCCPEITQILKDGGRSYLFCGRKSGGRISTRLIESNKRKCRRKIRENAVSRASSLTWTVV